MTNFSGLRAALLRGSMLIAPGLLGAAFASVGPAMAQSIPAGARPQGGQVVGGSASIGRGANTTTITQSSNRAAIDWRSFDVGRDQLVQFQQPSAAAMTLNRVTGPEPSVIAGRVVANGGIVLVNQSGVVFAGGSQVTAQSVIVSTADISNSGFLAGGRMVFDQAGKPGARIVNEGTITAGQAGLAALVAPEVANRGVIRAAMGTVILGGAERHVIDLNGDGLVSFDVTDAVRTQPAGGAALVTNSGTIFAQGGIVLLTAAAADGIVQALVRAGGSISAPTDAASGRTGRVLLTGTGGSIRVEGTIAAVGTAAGSSGGSIAVVADRVLVAAPARLDVSGRAGGGTIAVGTSLPGAKVARKADRTGIEAGAMLRADATGRGDGGRIIVNSARATAQAGTLSAQGGPGGGDGGTIEISSGGGLVFGGSTDVGAPAGLVGQVILDPQFITVVADTDPRINIGAIDIADLILGFADAPINAFIGAGQINGIGGNLVLQATATLTVGAGINKPAGGLALESNGTLSINAPVLLGGGDLSLFAPNIVIGALVQVGAGRQVILDPLAGNTAAGSITETAGGLIVAGVLTQTGLAFRDITLGGANQVGRIDRLNADLALTFTNAPSLLINGPVRGSNSVAIDVLAGDLTIGGPVTSNSSIDAVVIRASGSIIVNGSSGGAVNGGGITLAAAFDFANGTINAAGAGGIALGGSLFSSFDGGSSPIALGAGTGGIRQTAGVIQGTTLTVQSGGGASLTSTGAGFFTSNEINVLGPSTVAANFSLAAFKLASFGTAGVGGDLQLTGDIRAGGTLSLLALDTGMQELSGSRIFAARLDASARATGAPGAGGSITFGGDNQVAVLGTVNGFGVAVRNVVGLDIAGPVVGNGVVTIAVASGDLLVSGAVSALGSNLSLTAGGNVTVGGTGVATATVGDGGGRVSIFAASPDSGFAATLPGSVVLAGSISADVLSLGAGTGGITQTGGQIVTGDLTVLSGGAALLNRASVGTPNAVIRTVLDVSAAGSFALDTGGTALVIAGHVVAANIDLATSAALTLAQTCPPTTGVCVAVPALLNAGSGLVSLRAGSLALTNAGDSITGGVVEIAPRPIAGLVAGGVAGSSVGGALSVNQDVLARITAATLRLGATAPGGTSASTVQLVGPITVAGTLDLRSLGAITQAGGAALAIGTLTGNAGGAILLANGGNGIGTVGDVAAGGNVGLTVAGAMTLAGLLSAPGQTVSLVAGSGIAEIGAGRVTAGTLAAQTGSGNIALGGGNVVDALGAVASAGAFTFNDAVTVLSVAAGITVSAAAGIGITQSGAFALGGQLVAPGQTVVLTAGTGIAGAGAITAATLIAQTASGDIALTGANAVAGLGDVTTPGAFTFNDTAKLLTIAGGATITTGTGAAISDTGGLAINGQIAAAGQSVALVAGAGIGGGGSIVAALLDVQTTGGGIVLTGANRFDALVAGAPGNITINDNAAGLVVPGAVVAGGVVDIINSGNMTVDGTVRGGTVTLRAGGILADNGVVAATAGPLRLAGGGVVVGGDVASTVGIVVSANTATLGGRATGPALDINAPVITFTGLAAAGTTVRLGLGGSGVATGALDAGGLVVAGGSAATLTGRIAGIGGGAAAVLGVRADAAGTPFGNPPPAPNDFTMNGCPLAVTVCHPLLVAPPTVATNPVVVMGGLNPRRFTGELTDSWFRLPTPINVNLLLPAARDPNEDLDLAPPNVRAEDY